MEDDNESEKEKEGEWNFASLFLFPLLTAASRRALLPVRLRSPAATPLEKKWRTRRDFLNLQA